MNKKIYLKAFLIIAIFLIADTLFAQSTGSGGAGNVQKLNSEINNWKSATKLIVQSLIGLAAIGGGAYAYLKMQTDDGSGGKKAVLTFVGALIFGALFIYIVEFFLGA